MSLLKYILKRYWGVVALYILLIIGGIQSVEFFRAEHIWFYIYILILGGSMTGMSKIIYDEWKES